MVNLSKEERISRINLRKEEIHKTILEKSPNLNGITARVALILDYSGSMHDLYRSGVVQEVVEKIFPMALNFDDNGEMEVWLFHDSYHRLPNVNMSNFNDYISRETSGYSMGGTKYSPVMNDVYKKYIVEEPSDIPTYVIFITDGDNRDKTETNTTIRKLSNYPIFFQFVGVGNDSFSYLKGLDDLIGRYVDNANFFKVAESEDISYDNLLKEFPIWLKTTKKIGFPKNSEKKGFFSKLFKH